jgi:hypothetical protein
MENEIKELELMKAYKYLGAEGGHNITDRPTNRPKPTQPTKLHRANLLWNLKVHH